MLRQQSAERAAPAGRAGLYQGVPIHLRVSFQVQLHMPEIVLFGHSYLSIRLSCLQTVDHLSTTARRLGVDLNEDTTRIIDTVTHTGRRAS